MLAVCLVFSETNEQILMNYYASSVWPSEVVIILYKRLYPWCKKLLNIQKRPPLVEACTLRVLSSIYSVLVIILIVYKVFFFQNNITTSKKNFLGVIFSNSCKSSCRPVCKNVEGQTGKWQNVLNAIFTAKTIHMKRMASSIPPSISYSFDVHL